MPLPKKSDSWREALKFINRCPICSSAYDGKEAKLFAKNETATLVHLTCTSCASYFVAMVLLVGQGVSSVGMVTDLSFDDVKRLYQSEPFTTDEIIDAHEQMDQRTFIHSLILNG
jgi:hypothetical protein